MRDKGEITKKKKKKKKEKTNKNEEWVILEYMDTRRADLISSIIGTVKAFNESGSLRVIFPMPLLHLMKINNIIFYRMVVVILEFYCLIGIHLERKDKLFDNFSGFQPRAHF
jgi:hypothetical protein